MALNYMLCTIYRRYLKINIKVKKLTQPQNRAMSALLMAAVTGNCLSI
jgi:hypothetical protein